MPYLAFNLNNGNEFCFDLVEDRLSLGRNPLNGIVIENTCISGFHAEFVRQPDGRYLLVDLKSANGTFVNGARTSSAVLKPNDKVHFSYVAAYFRGGTGPGTKSSKANGAFPEERLVGKAAEE